MTPTLSEESVQLSVKLLVETLLAARPVGMVGGLVSVVVTTRVVLQADQLPAASRARTVMA